MADNSDDVSFVLPQPNGTDGEASVVATGERTRLILAGDIDLQMVSELNEAIDECERRAAPLDIDMRNVTFMDSAGIATFARMISGECPVMPIRLIKAPRVVRYLFEVTGLAASVEMLEEDPGHGELTPWPDTPVN